MSIHLYEISLTSLYPQRKPESRKPSSFSLSCASIYADDVPLFHLNFSIHFVKKYDILLFIILICIWDFKKLTTSKKVSIFELKNNRKLINYFGIFKSSLDSIFEIKIIHLKT